MKPPAKTSSSLWSAGIKSAKGLISIAKEASMDYFGLSSIQVGLLKNASQNDTENYR